mgnify:CR=1 FL=1
MDDLLKDAIADAKAVRETALANAKLALEEAFTPRIQSMLSQKIQSEIEDEDEVADEVEDADEDEVPAEAPEMEAPAEEAPEVAVEPEEGEEVADIADEVEDEDEAMHEEEDEDEGYKESNVIEIDGVKYAPVVSEEEEDEDEAMHEEEDEDEGYSEDLDLEAVLAELEGETVTEEEDEDEIAEGEEKEDEDEMKKEGEEKEDEDEAMHENDVSSEIGAADNKLKPEAGDSSKIGQGPEGEGSDKPAGKELEDQEIVDDLKEDIEVTEDIDLEEVLKALTEEEDEDEVKDESVEESVNEEVNTLKADLEEHRNVVKYLRGKLNEVNLLNAKLLFTNKLFRNFGLSNEQKLKVVETFDRATNLREVKLVFSTLAESFGNKVASKPSKPIKESKGSSSKPVASTKPKTEEVISEGSDMKARFQKLAKII